MVECKESESHPYLVAKEGGIRVAAEIIEWMRRCPLLTTH